MTSSSNTINPKNFLLSYLHRQTFNNKIKYTTCVRLQNTGMTKYYGELKTSIYKPKYSCHSRNITPQYSHYSMDISNSISQNDLPAIPNQKLQTPQNESMATQTNVSRNGNDSNKKSITIPNILPSHKKQGNSKHRRMKYYVKEMNFVYTLPKVVALGK